LDHGKEVRAVTDNCLIFRLKQAGYNNLVIPVPMSSFKTKAQRAGFSAMSNERLGKELNYSIPLWEEGVTSYIRHAMRT
jgi:dTDP-4-dehydrorhamnose reductase